MEEVSVDRRTGHRTVDTTSGRQVTIEYHELVNVQLVEDDSEFVIARSRALLSAVRRQRDYTVVGLLKHEGVDGSILECIVVDVESDGIPPKNEIGINYRERLVLCVSEDAKRLVEVLALRKDFPILIHQNQGVAGAPASLCLYFEPSSAVLRTWTPQNFLRRIQWWLEKSSKGELHTSDQPLEHLFFSTKYELILPWNFDELLRVASQKFVIVKGPKRADQGLTMFVEPITEATKPRSPSVAYVELTLAPIVQGFIERDPATLGALSEILSSRGVNILPALEEALQQRVSQNGVAASSDDATTVILLHIPVRRSEGLAPERTIHRAFIVLTGAMKLGVATGALFEHEGKYFSAAGLLNNVSPTLWQTAPLTPMEVLHSNSAAAARQQSGISEEGPSGVLIGAGSLGSAMLNLWGRSGWGQWTAVDKDHVKPHNLARHVAFNENIGEAKSSVVVQLHDAVMQGTSTIVGINADACDLSQESVAKAIGAAKLVVDASTTLEYPRLASTLHNVGRHISVFITPSGNAAVLLAEDSQRATRLRTLEGQYYRAVIAEDWGQRHLEGNLSSFWSGASCRDISVVLPYSRIMAHASTLAEQIRLAAAQDNARIRIWHRDPDTGSVLMRDVPTHAERRFSLEPFDIFVDAGVEQRLRQLRTASFPNETGGVLLGYYDLNINTVVVVDGLPAPLDSRSSPAAFERGIAGVAEAVMEAGRRTAGIVGYIGEWHSHPPGHSAAPSSDDFVQLIHLALGMSADGLPAVQIIVGEHDLQVLQAAVRG